MQFNSDTHYLKSANLGLPETPARFKNPLEGLTELVNLNPYDYSLL